MDAPKLSKLLIRSHVNLETKRTNWPITEEHPPNCQTSADPMLYEIEDRFDPLLHWLLKKSVL
tara:strand:- start:273 stop:461 length:189 start_codon:yes stop_codon:yes gene_type:complete